MIEPFSKLPERMAAYEDIIEAFYKKIKSGHIKLDDRLPSERDLAEQFGVGRSTIREALKSLAAMGILEVKPGSGTYVRLPNMNHFKKHLQWILYLNPAPLEELIELRTVLELHMTEKAALSRTQEDLAEIEQTLREMREVQNRPEQNKKIDLKFHLAISKASGIKLMSDLLELTRYSLEEWFEYVLSDKHSLRDTIEEHTQIYQAIKNQNPEEAQKLMRRHLQLGKERLMKAIGNRIKPSKEMT